MFKHKLMLRLNDLYKLNLLR